MHFGRAPLELTCDLGFERTLFGRRIRRWWWWLVSVEQIGHHNEQGERHSGGEEHDAPFLTFGFGLAFFMMLYSFFTCDWDNLLSYRPAEEGTGPSLLMTR